MSSSTELGKVTPVEKAKLTLKEQAIDNIENYIKDAELDSSRFQAFADYVDHLDAKKRSERMLHDEDRTERHSKLNLIEETIRQRQNGIRGYKEEFDNVPQLIVPLEKALVAESKANHGNQANLVGIYHSEFPNQLINIKNKAIARKNQQPVFQLQSGK